MLVHAPGLTPEEIIASITIPVNARYAFNEAAPGTVVLERMAKPIARDGYWVVGHYVDLAGSSQKAGC